jgi:hypothetical protein
MVLCYQETVVTIKLHRSLAIGAVIFFTDMIKALWLPKHVVMFRN